MKTSALPIIFTSELGKTLTFSPASRFPCVKATKYQELMPDPFDI